MQPELNPLVSQFRQRHLGARLILAQASAKRAQRALEIFDHLIDVSPVIISNWMDHGACGLQVERREGQEQILVDLYAKDFLSAVSLAEQISTDTDLRLLTLARSHDGAYLRLEPQVDAMMRQMNGSGPALEEMVAGGGAGVPTHKVPGYMALARPYYFEIQNRGGRFSETKASVVCFYAAPVPYNRALWIQATIHLMESPARCIATPVGGGIGGDVFERWTDRQLEICDPALEAALQFQVSQWCGPDDAGHYWLHSD